MNTRNQHHRWSPSKIFCTYTSYSTNIYDGPCNQSPPEVKPGNHTDKVNFMSFTKCMDGLSASLDLPCPYLYTRVAVGMVTVCLPACACMCEVHMQQGFVGSHVWFVNFFTTMCQPCQLFHVKARFFFPACGPDAKMDYQLNCNIKALVMRYM